MYMKKTLKIILFSCIVGTLLATTFFLSIKEKASAKNKPVLYAFQVGVFKNKDNANNFKNRYETAKVFWDDEYYRVFIGITSENKEILEGIFNEKNYSYYVKELDVTDELEIEVKKYDELYRQTSEENKSLVLKNLLESLPNEL